MRREPLHLRALWAPVNLVQLLFTLGWSAFWIGLALLLRLVSRRPGIPRFLARRVWAPGLLVGAGARVTVRGAEQLDPARAWLLVANHSSWIDIAVLYRVLPVDPYFIAKRELGRVPFLGSFMRVMGMVLVDRKAARRASDAVGQAAALLATGRSVVSFPEGTRSRDGRVGRFKSGGFGAALASGCAVVPVAIRGAGDVLPADGFRVRPGPIEVRIGAPIAVAPFQPDDRAGLARRAEQAVAELLADE